MYNVGTLIKSLFTVFDYGHSFTSVDMSHTNGQSVDKWALRKKDCHI